MVERTPPVNFALLLYAANNFGPCVVFVYLYHLADPVVVEKSERLSDLLVGIQLGVPFLHCNTRL